MVSFDGQRSGFVSFIKRKIENKGLEIQDSRKLSTNFSEGNLKNEYYKILASWSETREQKQKLHNNCLVTDTIHFRDPPRK